MIAAVYHHVMARGDFGQEHSCTGNSERVSLIMSGRELEDAVSPQLLAILSSTGREPVRLNIAGDKVLIVESTEDRVRDAASCLQPSLDPVLISALSTAVTNSITGGINAIRCDNFTLDFSEPRVMGILNVTPDSFSDGGQYFDKQDAVDRGVQMVDEGAYIIDIGGESTKPGSKPVRSSDELKRIVPVIRELRSRTDVPISVDTYHHDVALEALKNGADIINDVTGLRTEKMREVVRYAGCPFIVMHMLGRPANMQRNPSYDDVVYEVMRFLMESLQTSENEGMDVTKAIVDPGIGFGKSFQHNVTLLNRLNEFLTIGHPIMVGVSRKKFIGRITGGNERNRLDGSIAAAVLAYMNGARLLRVHDVLETQRALAVARTIVTGKMVEHEPGRVS